MLKLWDDSLANMFTFLLVHGIVSGKGSEDGNTTPFGTFVQGNEKFTEDVGIDDKDSSIGRRRGWKSGGDIMYVSKSKDSICDDL